MDGLWTAEFGTSAGIFGGGVAVFLGGKIMGGDSTYYYVGEYRLNGNALNATLRVFPFIAGARSVFNTLGREITLEIVGSLVGQDRVIAQGHSKEMPQVNFGVKLTKRS